MLFSILYWYKEDSRYNNKKVFILQILRHIK